MAITGPTSNTIGRICPKFHSFSAACTSGSAFFLTLATSRLPQTNSKANTQRLATNERKKSKSASVVPKRMQTTLKHTLSNDDLSFDVALSGFARRSCMHRAVHLARLAQYCNGALRSLREMNQHCRFGKLLKCERARICAVAYDESKKIEH